MKYKFITDYMGNIRNVLHEDNTEVAQNTIIEMNEILNKKVFWENYNSIKKYNSHLTKYDLLRAAVQSTAKYGKGLVLEEFKINFDTMKCTYKLRKQF